MIEPKARYTILLIEIEEDADISAACYIDHVELQAVTRLLNNQQNYDNDESCHNTSCPKEADEVANILTHTNPLLTDELLHQRLKSRNEISQFQIAIGSTTASTGNYILPDEDFTPNNVSSDESCAIEDVLLDKIYKNHIQKHSILMALW